MNCTSFVIQEELNWFHCERLLAKSTCGSPSWMAAKSATRTAYLKLLVSIGALKYWSSAWAPARRLPLGHRRA